MEGGWAAWSGGRGPARALLLVRARRVGALSALASVRKRVLVGPSLPSSPTDSPSTTVKTVVSPRISTSSTESWSAVPGGRSTQGAGSSLTAARAGRRPAVMAATHVVQTHWVSRAMKRWRWRRMKGAYNDGGSEWLDTFVPHSSSLPPSSPPPPFSPF